MSKSGIFADYKDQIASVNSVNPPLRSRHVCCRALAEFKNWREATCIRAIFDCNIWFVFMLSNHLETTRKKANGPTATTAGSSHQIVTCRGGNLRLLSF